MKQALLSVLGALVLSVGAHAGGELYGTIQTAGGETFPSSSRNRLVRCASTTPHSIDMMPLLSPERPD